MFGKKQPARCSTSPSHAVRPSGLLCCGSDGLERTARQHLRYGSVDLLFQTSSEDSSLLLVLVHQRIRGFAFIRYRNPRLTLTLIQRSDLVRCLVYYFFYISARFLEKYRWIFVTFAEAVCNWCKIAMLLL